MTKSHAKPLKPKPLNTCLNMFKHKMQSEIIKQTIRLGNSAGVVLPKNWTDKKVRIQLIEKSITEEVIDILINKNLLEEVIGIYLVGSYARQEETLESDIDLLIITENLNKQIKKGNYELVFISKDKFKKNIKKNLYLLSLVKEAKTILNNNFIKNYKKTEIKIPIKKYLSEIKKVTKINKETINLNKELGKKVSDGTAYSLILRLRELYLIKCLIKNKVCMNKEFLELIKNTSGSLEAYKAYLRIKNNNSPRENLEIKQAEKLIKYTKEFNKKLEKEK